MDGDMKYLATFYTHYGAMHFHKHCVKEGVSAKMAPVPRELSASCGVCVRFESERAACISDHADMECCYVVATDGSFAPDGFFPPVAEEK